MSTHLHATLAQRADGIIEVGHGAGMRYGMRWQLEGARAAEVEVDAGRAVYREALESTDIVWTGDEHRAELFFVLRDAAAPTSFRWRVTLGSDLIRGETSAAGGGVGFFDATGRKRLRVGAAHAVDAGGTRRDAALAWSDGALELNLDTRGLQFPILLDPPLETVEWDLVMPSNWPPTRRFESAGMAFDSARGKTVLFGGTPSPDFGTMGLDDTWEWDGTSWIQRMPATSPGARSSHAMAYDSARGKTVLFGGSQDVGCFSPLADTWEWDGTNWSQRTPATSPPAQCGHTMAYDSARGKTVLIGKTIMLGSMVGNTWEWDGTNWTESDLITVPDAGTPPLLDAGASLPDAGTLPTISPLGSWAAFDSARSKTVLVTNGETWEWDGMSWTQKVSNGPSGVVAYDSARGRTVLVDILGPSPPTTWEWDGTTWAQQMPVTRPKTDQDNGVLVYDSARGKTVYLVGYLYPVNTWEWDGMNWTQRWSSTSPRPNPDAIVYDSAHGEAVVLDTADLFATTSSSTWEWDGASWTQQMVSTGPIAQLGYAMAYDSARAKTVLYNGDYSSETWEWDGTSWAQRMPATSPPALSDHAMAYDSARAKTVLFGGGTMTAQLAETWEWDGTNWTQVASATNPSPRYGHRMAYDTARGKTVLFGGYHYDTMANTSTWCSDTWEWDGTNWTQRTPAVSPPGREQHGLAYDSARGLTVMFGGAFVNGQSWAALSDTWEWDGTNWTQQMPTTNPSGGQMAYDSAHGRTVLFDGASGATWTYWGSGGACTSDAQCEIGQCMNGVCTIAADGGSSSSSGGMGGSSSSPTSSGAGGSTTSSGSGGSPSTGTSATTSTSSSGAGGSSASASSGGLGHRSTGSPSTHSACALGVVDSEHREDMVFVAVALMGFAGSLRRHRRTSTRRITASAQGARAA
jgi:hypothetical protein